MTNHRAAAAEMANECLCFRARRVSRALTRLYDEALRPLGIQATQLTVLNVIAMMSSPRAAKGGQPGGSIGGVAEVLGMDSTTLSRNVRPLEKEGLVRITRSEADRRVRLLRLTSDGELLVAEALPRWKEAHGRVVNALGADAAAALHDQFDATIAAAKAGADTSSSSSTRRTHG